MKFPIELTLIGIIINCLVLLIYPNVASLIALGAFLIHVIWLACRED